jgi:hypothetical protein
VTAEDRMAPAQVPGQLIRLLLDRMGGRRASSSLRRALALFLLAGLIGLLPFAHASPPDPIWIPGVYDGADYDDVIVLVTEAGAIVEPAPVVLESASRVVGLLPPPSAPAPSRASVFAVHPRSPPLV